MAKNTQVIKRFIDEVWNQGRESAIDELYVPDGRAYGLGDSYRDGPANFKLFHQLIMATCSDIRFDINDIKEEGDRVSFFSTVTLKHKLTGKSVTFQGGGYARLADGKIAEAHNAFDFLGLLIQIGAASPDVLPRALMGAASLS